MVRVNNNFSKIRESYLFSEIAHKTAEYRSSHVDAKIISLGIGDVTRPLCNEVIKSLHTAVDEMGVQETFRGYGPEQGYKFLIEKIIKHDYNSRGITLDADEVFISDGAKSDLGNIGDLFDTDNLVVVTDPVYPVYVDTNIMAGRADNIMYMSCSAENNFIPTLPEKTPDIIYLCYPNNPTGTTLTKSELKKFVDFAKEKGSLILYDSAYEAFITEEDVPHSIYEIPGAKDVAIEFRSFSKTAGFTGVRCGYTVVPKTVKASAPDGSLIALNKLWNRRQCTKFNGTSYIVQRAAEAVYSPQGQKETKENIAYYLNNANFIREGLASIGMQVYGGVNAPYIWVKTPQGMGSWDFFDFLLEKCNVVVTPGVGFGPSGEGYVRMTSFGTKENCEEAIDRIKKILI
ncbi:MAG: LL-diaminopimelate aminotransferase [Bacteroidales bacterium]|nr:LL-diaminopimelate aminotransferase [Bacteroidales bacterium]